VQDASALVLLFERERWRPLLRPFAAVGRMALSCYLFTLLLDSFINQGWGLGQFGRVMPAAGTLARSRRRLRESLQERNPDRTVVPGNGGSHRPADVRFSGAPPPTSIRERRTTAP